MSKIILAVIAMFFSGQRCSRRGCGLWVGGIPAFFLISISAMSLSGCAGMIYGGNSAFRATSSPEYINVDKIQLDFGTGNGLLTTLNALTPVGFLAPLFGVPRKTYMGGLNLTVTPQDAMNGIDRNALTFVAPQDQSVTVTLDFNAKLREQLTQSGQGTKYFPGKLIITIVCKRAICRASSDPDIISSTGAITLQTRHLVYEKRMSEIKVEEQKLKSIWDRVPEGFRSRIKTPDVLVDTAKAPASRRRDLIPIRIKDSDTDPFKNGIGWLPRESSDGYYVGFANPGGLRGGWREDIPEGNPAFRSPAGFVMFQAHDGTKAALLLDDVAWKDARLFIIKVVGDALLDAKNGGRGAPAFGLFLSPVALYTREGNWHIVDPAYAPPEKKRKLSPPEQKLLREATRQASICIRLFDTFAFEDVYDQCLRRRIQLQFGSRENYARELRHDWDTALQNKVQTEILTSSLSPDGKSATFTTEKTQFNPHIGQRHVGQGTQTFELEDGRWCSSQ